MFSKEEQSAPSAHTGNCFLVKMFHENQAAQIYLAVIINLDSSGKNSQNSEYFVVIEPVAMLWKQFVRR